MNQGRAKPVKLSMNELTTLRWSFEQDVNNYVAAGIQAMGVWRQKLSDFGEEKGIQLLLERGVNVSCLLWTGGFTGSDGRSHKDSICDGLEAVRLAAAMQADCLIVYSGARAGHTHKHARRLLWLAIQAMLPLAHDLDVTLGVEPMHVGCADNWTFLTCLDEAIALLDSLGSPQVKLVFDTYHLAQDPAVLARIPEIVDRIALVQLADAKHPPLGEQNRCFLGEGNLPLKRVVTALRDAGYEGYWDVELMGEEVEDWDYHDLLSCSRETLNAMFV